MSASDSCAVNAMRTGKDEWKRSMPLKAVWLAGFMRGYRYRKDEDVATDRPNGGRDVL
ncbi:hypothetical protein PFZ55_52540 [Streptomyces sp. MS2A]|nr:hypothetical protein [Streptomyces sp. MS2A]